MYELNLVRAYRHTWILSINRKIKIPIRENYAIKDIQYRKSRYTDNMMIRWNDDLMKWWCDDMMIWEYDDKMIWWYDDMMIKW